MSANERLLAAFTAQIGLKDNKKLLKVKSDVKKTIEELLEGLREEEDLKALLRVLALEQKISIAKDGLSHVKRENQEEYVKNIKNTAVLKDEERKRISTQKAVEDVKEVKKPGKSADPPQKQKDEPKVQASTTDKKKAPEKITKPNGELANAQSSKITVSNKGTKNVDQGNPSKTTKGVKSSKYNVAYRQPIFPVCMPKAKKFLPDSAKDTEWFLVTVGNQAVPVPKNKTFEVISFNYGGSRGLFEYLYAVFGKRETTTNLVVASDPGWFFNGKEDGDGYEETAKAFINFSDSFHRPPRLNVYFLGFPVNPTDVEFDGRLGRFNALTARLFEETGQYVSLAKFIPKNVKKGDLARPNKDAPTLLNSELNAHLLQEAMEYLITRKTNVAKKDGKERVEVSEIAKTSKNPEVETIRPNCAADKPTSSTAGQPVKEETVKKKTKKGKKQRAAETRNNADQSVPGQQNPQSSNNTEDADEFYEATLTSETIQKLQLVLHTDAILRADLLDVVETMDTFEGAARFKFEFIKKNKNEVFQSRKAFYHMFVMTKEIFSDINKTLSDDYLLGFEVLTAVQGQLCHIDLDTLGKWFKDGIRDTPHLKILLSQENRIAGTFYLVTMHAIFVLKTTRLPYGGNRIVVRNAHESEIVWKLKKRIAKLMDLVQPVDCQVFAKNFRHLRRTETAIIEVTIRVLQHFDPSFDADVTDDCRLGVSIKSTAIHVLSSRSVGEIVNAYRADALGPSICKESEDRLGGDHTDVDLDFLLCDNFLNTIEKIALSEFETEDQNKDTERSTSSRGESAGSRRSTGTDSLTPSSPSQAAGPSGIRRGFLLSGVVDKPQEVNKGGCSLM